MKKRNSKISRFDRWMMAVTFGEAGEAKTAMELMGERTGKRNRKQKGRKIETRIDPRPRLMA
jgi:hypothetical protein